MDWEVFVLMENYMMGDDMVGFRKLWVDLINGVCVYVG